MIVIVSLLKSILSSRNAAASLRDIAAIQLQSLVLPVDVPVTEFSFLHGVHDYWVIFICQGDHLVILNSRHLRLFQDLFDRNRKTCVNEVGNNLAVWKGSVPKLSLPSQLRV